MIKITLAINPFAPSKHALDFAAFLARLTDSPVTAAMLENKDLVQLQEDALPGRGSEQPDLIIDQTIHWFKEAASSREVGCKIHRDRSMPFEELIAESRFSDVLVVHPAISFSKSFAGEFTKLAKDILKRAECPVFVVSNTMERVDEIFFAYDKSASSMFSLKSFLYLFPMLAHTKLTVLHVTPDKTADDPSHYFFAEWLKTHFHGTVGYKTLTGETDQQLVQFFSGKQNAVIVMGAYKRHAGFTLRSKSYAEWMVRQTSLPVFISHR